jgi:hypothetical protein
MAVPLYRVGLPDRRVGPGTVRGDAVGREEPGIEDGEVGGDDREEEEQEADDLRDVEVVVGFENEGEDDQGGNGEADNDACDGLGPGFVIVGKHAGLPFILPDIRCCEVPVVLAAAAGSTCYQYGSVGCAEAVVYIYDRSAGRTGV